MVTRVSLAELAGAGFILHSAEAAAIVVDVCRQMQRGAIRGIPSTHVIRLTPDGAILTEGPITTDQPPIAKAAQLLNDLLPPFDAPPAYRVPGGLRLVVARALGTLDLPPFASLDEFCVALSRFAADDLASVGQNLYRAWDLARTPRTLTVSDLRRARRATGLSLEDISSACGVSAVLLRELEWGYLKNWRNDAVGRTWLSGYAKASGLDEQLVTSIVVPMLEEENPWRFADEHRDFGEPASALVASGPQAIVPAPAPETSQRRRAIVFCAAAASAAGIAVVAILAAPAWPRPSVQARAEPAPAFVAAPVRAPSPAPAPVPAQASSPGSAQVSTPVAGQVSGQIPAEAPAAAPASVDAVPAVQTHAGAKSHVARARATVKRPPAPARKPSPKPNFFKRELLRIVIK